MDKQTVRSILQDALEKEFSTTEVDLWPTVQARLVAKSQGEKMKTSQASRIPRIAFAVLTVVLLLAFFLFSPQGHVLAQNILKFFALAEQDRYPLQDWQKTPPAQTSSESPFTLSVQQAEELAGYDVLSPLEIPSEMIFVGASYDEKYHIVAQAFGQSADYLEFSIWEQPLEYYESCGDISHLCDNMLGGNLAGASADIQVVQIGDLTGEYVEGVWSLTDNGPVWDPTPYAKTLRWQTDTMILELVYNGTDLGRDDLVAIAASLR